MGKTILITDREELGREDVLEFYRKRDVIEKMFDVIKNELSSKRLRVSSRAVVEGRIFLTFLSLILYFEVHRVMKEEGLYKSYTISEVFNELKKLKVVTLKNGKGYLTEVTRRQRTIFEKFNIPIPTGT